MNLKLEPNSLLFHFYHGNHALVFVWGKGEGSTILANQHPDTDLYICIVIN